MIDDERTDRIRKVIPRTKTVLHLGCGSDILPDVTNVDFEKFEGVDQIANLNEKLLWADNSVDGIIIIHALEHLDYYSFMREALRILRPGAKMFVVVPYWTNHHAAIGEHRTPGFSWVAFEHFRDPNHPFNSFKVLQNKIMFGNKLSFLNGFVALFSGIYDRFFAGLFPAVELEVILEKR